jgi:DNA polymerase III subunit delta'
MTTDQTPVAEAAPPWIDQQLTALLQQRGHAWLLSGPSGLGQYRLALDMVRAWLCEQPVAGRQTACGSCASCHAIEVRTHADLCVLMPETTMIELGWPLSEKAQSDIDDKKRKASKEIRIEAMRDAIEFSQRTSARGRGKAVLVFPAERMNNVTANALLKTLEEPPGDVKFVLASEAAHQLLPTIRSRCLGHAMLWPDESAALAWLKDQNLSASEARVLLRAAGGRPDDALFYQASGRGAAHWAALPKAMQRGEVSALKDCTPAQAVDGLHKLCHDLLALKMGAAPRFFEAAHLPQPDPKWGAVRASTAALTRWARELAKTSRTVDHPFNPGLMLEALASQAKNALNSQH